MTDERTCETCEFSEMYWAPKGATTRRICKRSGASCAVERSGSPLVLGPVQRCGVMAVFWKKKEWV